MHHLVYLISVTAILGSGSALIQSFDYEENFYLMLSCAIALLASLSGLVMLVRNAHHAAEKQPPPKKMSAEIKPSPLIQDGPHAVIQDTPHPDFAPEPKYQPKMTISAPSRDDDPLNNKPWVKLVDECVRLYGELDAEKSEFDPPRQEVVDHVMCRLQEILERSKVQTISDDTIFDFSHHQAGTKYKKVEPGTTIVETLSPGFRVGPKVFRKAQVVLAAKEPEVNLEK
jgi:hypothetical protein